MENTKVIVGMILAAGSLLTAQIILAQEVSPRDKQLKHLVQMPIAVKKSVNLGIPDHNSEEIAKSLQKGKLEPETFNAVFYLAPYMMMELKNFSAPENFLISQIEQGLYGDELATSVLEELRKFGVDDSVQIDDMPLPINENFFTDRIQQSIQKIKDKTEIEGYGRDKSPDAKTNPDQESNQRRRPRRPPNQGGQFPFGK